MSGPSNAALLILMCMCAAGLRAQFLPELDRFEVENVRLVLLDSAGQRRGVLEGTKARRDDKGVVRVEEAVLTFKRNNGLFVVRAKDFRYTPRTSQFNAPQGLTAELPDGGALEVPEGSGTIEFSDGVKFNMNCTGEVKLRMGAEGTGLLSAAILNPVVALVADEVGSGAVPSEIALESVTITGQRGGTMRLRLASAPAFGNEAPKGPAYAALSCFGDVSLAVTDKVSLAKLFMLRRASMGLDPDSSGTEAETFAITSTSLEIRGRVAHASGATTLVNPEFDATGNVHLSSRRLRGSSQRLYYREQALERSARMEENVALELQQGLNDTGQATRLAFRASDYIDMRVPIDSNAIGTTSPEQLRTVLNASARVERYAGKTLEWQLRGTLIRLFSFRASAEDVFQHRFDAHAEGYSALLRVNPQENAGNIDVEGASAYGLRAEGSFVHGRATARIYGPDVLAVVDSDFALAHELRKALGLREPAKAQGYRGRLTVRAQSVLDLDTQAELGIDATDRMAVFAEGNVELLHESLPRDDRRLVALAGQSVSLLMEDRELRGASVTPVTGARMRAVLGFDLLECRGLLTLEEGAGSYTQLDGPGTLTVRDPDSIAYVHQALSRLPRAKASAPELRPDAGWFDFGANMLLRQSATERTLTCDQPVLNLVRGEFQPPRSGFGAFNDLPELLEADVVELYFIRADSLYASTQGQDEAAVNVLRLAGNPVLRSKIDGISASARTAIELSGADRQSEDDAPFTLVMLDDAQVNIERAGDFFGGYVETGVFGYDGSWKLKGAKRLEITQRPLAVPNAEVLPAIRKLLDRAQKSEQTSAEVEADITDAISLLGAFAAPTDVRRNLTEGMQPVRARDELAKALRRLKEGFREPAVRNTRRAAALLAALYDVAGFGGVDGEFSSVDAGTPPMKLAMREALFTFNGLGEVVDAAAQGPIVLTRGSYEVTGKALSRSVDGVLTLDGAAIKLPANTGVEVVGVERISLRQDADRTSSDVGEARRTMVTRISGRKLGVRLNLQQEPANGNGNRSSR